VHAVLLQDRLGLVLPFNLGGGISLVRREGLRVVGRHRGALAGLEEHVIDMRVVAPQVAPLAVVSLDRRGEYRLEACRANRHVLLARGVPFELLDLGGL